MAAQKQQPSGKERARPGEKGGGKYYRVEVRSKEQFSAFRTHDVGRSGHTQRLAGKRQGGSWATKTWLISKDDAKIEGDTLVAKQKRVQKVLDQLGSKPKHVKGDIFRAKPRPKVSEKDKPTPAQKKARSSNINNAQRTRKKD